jgi:SAM-dependent methyltransferase
MHHSGTEWFETWFDTPLYEMLYAARDYGEAAKLSRLISTHFPVNSYPDVLDAACGRGRHAFNLAELGYSVDGADLSAIAISRAGKLAENHPKKHSLHFFEHDMRQPLPKSYSLVVNLFTSFGYFDEDDSNLLFLQNIAGAVRPGGGLVIDFLNPAYVRKNLVPDETLVTGNYNTRITRYVDADTVCKKMVFTSLSTGIKQEFTERVKLYGPRWFEKAFYKLNLELRQVFGDYDGSPFDSKTSPRQLMMLDRSA